MSTPVITWKPRGESTEVSLDLQDLGGLFRLQGFNRTNKAQQISQGRKAVTLNFGMGAGYAIEVRNIPRSREVASVKVWNLLSSFVSHADGGGRFSFTINKNKTAFTAVNGAVAQGATVVPVVSSLGFADGDLIYIQDALDPTKYEVRGIQSISVNNITLDGQITYSFADQSLFYHWEYFPICVAVGAVGPRERTAGRGLNTWDWNMNFETLSQ